MERCKERLLAFLFPAETDHWITCLRVGLGLQVILYTLSLGADWNFLFGSTEVGLGGRAFSEALLSTESPFVPRLGWLVALGSRIGFSEGVALSLVWWALLGAGFGLLAGFFSRTAASLAWLLHLGAAKSGGLVAYGVDNFMTIGLFYLMLAPLPDRYALDYRLWKPSPKDRQLLGFWRRVLQVHLCLIYFFGGLAKCLGRGWWDGTNIWRALIRPPFNVIDPAILVQYKALFPFAGAAACLLETGYIFLIWPRRIQPVWLACVCAFHLTIGLMMGLYLFALIMIALNLAAFGAGLRRKPTLGARVEELS